MIEHAIETARRSEHVFRARLCAVITDKSGKVISKGINQRKTHPLQIKHAGRINPEACFLHAEIAALVKCRGVPHTMFVARVLKDGTPALAKPCPICQAAIEEAGIKEVVYTLDANQVERWEV